MKKLNLDLNEHTGVISYNIIKNISKKLDSIMEYVREADLAKLRNILAKNIGVKEENILFTNGVYHGLHIVFDIFSSRDEIIIPVPTFPFYDKYEKFNKFKIKKIPIGSLDFLDVQKIIDSCSKKTKAIYLCNPNNPTGTIIMQKDLNKLIKFCSKKRIFMVVDEVFTDFSKISVIKNVRNFKNIIVLRTFSKALGMAGIKLGFIISDKSIIKKLRIIRGPPYALSKLALVIGEIILKDKKNLDGYLEDLDNSRKLITGFLKSRTV